MRFEQPQQDLDANERDKDLELKAIREQFREPLKKPVQTTPRAKQPAQRVPLHLPVEFVRQDGTLGQGRVENISFSGALILAPTCFVIGEHLLLYLSFVPGATMTSLRSRIVRLHSQGAGVTFTQADERTKMLLHQLLPRLARHARR